MARFYAERVAFTTGTTDAGNISIGSRLGNSFRLPSETTIADGDNPILLIQEGNDCEIVEATYVASGPHFTIATPIFSIISGTVGTTKMDLNGTAEVRFLPPTALDIAQFALRNAANTFSAKNTFSDELKLQRALEKVTITADNPASGDNNYDAVTQSIQYYTTANDTNWGLNIRGDGAASLDSIMAVGEMKTVALMATNTGTPYYQTSLKVDGSAVTPKWLGRDAPVAGNASAIDVYTFAILKTASATFTVIATMSKAA